jgi:hypothetical protein
MHPAHLIFCPHRLSQDPRAVEVERRQSHTVNELYPALSSLRGQRKC